VRQCQRTPEQQEARREYDRMRRAQDPERYRAKQRANYHRWKEKHRDVDRARQRLWAYQNRTKRYGLTRAQYDELAFSQGHLCAICRKPETSLYRGKPRKLAVDHDHDTKVVRGLLCTTCNQGLGLFHDDVEKLRGAIAYLTRASQGGHQ